MVFQIRYTIEYLHTCIRALFFSGGSFSPGPRRSSPYQTQRHSSTKSGPAGDSKRGVTFKSGLLADRVQEQYTGPLLHMDQVCIP